MTLAAWQMSWDGFVMGDGTPYVIQKATGFGDSAPVRTSDVPRGRRHGSRTGDEYLADRVIAATIDVDGTTHNDGTYDELFASIVPGTTHTGELRGNVPGIAGGTEFVVFCRCRRRALPADQNYAAGIGALEVEWSAADPRIYAGTETTITIPVADQTAGGAAFPLEFPLSFGDAVAGGMAYPVNAGNFETPWRATIRGPVAYPRIENVYTGQTLRIDASLAAGEYIDLDSDSGAVLLNGEAPRQSWLGPLSTWWPLQPGMTAMRFAAGTASPDATLTLTYRSAWN